MRVLEPQLASLADAAGEAARRLPVRLRRMEIQGSHDPKFAPVREAFADNFKRPASRSAPASR